MTLFGSMMSLVAAGCATGSTETRHGLGAGEWTARLPTSSSPIQQLAYGRGGSSQPDALADLDSASPDAVLAPSLTEVAVVKAKRAAPRTQRSAYAQTEVAKATPEKTAAELPADRVVAAQPEQQLAVNDATPDARYAERESQAQDQQQFRGGDAIIITAGALVVILLIVLLILLLR
jgi:hypothetical protein